jgi:peptidoglycan/LPS O-acetylase OafA/YrhL
VTSSIPAAVAEPTPPAPRARLRELDAVRLLTFASVVLVHTITVTVPGGDVPMYGLVILLHFTRQVFFALTVFVLLLGQLRRPTPMRRFWPKRFLLVGVPYVVWSAVYCLLMDAGHPPSRWPQDLAAFGLDLLTGSAWYHLYFLLVTMQVYLLVPLIAWVVRRTRGRHAVVLVAAFAVQAGLAALQQYEPFGSLGWYATGSKRFFWTYLFMIMAGAIAAHHAPAFLAWVRGHRRLIAALAAVGAATTLAVYALQLALGQTPGEASKPLQPIVLVWSVIVALGFVAAGGMWADRHPPGSRSARVLDRLSDRSFGIFLVHPLLIWELLHLGHGWLPDLIPPSGLLTLVVVLITAIGSYLIADLVRRTPLSLPLAGRPRKP